MSDAELIVKLEGQMLRHAKNAVSGEPWDASKLGRQAELAAAYATVVLALRARMDNPVQVYGSWPAHLNEEIAP